MADETVEEVVEEVEVAAETSESGTPEVQEQVAETPEPEPQNRFLEYVKEKAGRDLTSKYRTDEELAKGFDNLLTRVGQKTQAEQLGEQVAPYLNDFQAYLASRNQRPVEKPPEPEKPKPLFSVPKLEDGDLDYVEQDEAGKPKLKFGTPADVRQRLLAKAKYTRDMEERPEEVFTPALQTIEQRAAEAAYQRISQEMARQREFEAQQNYEYQLTQRTAGIVASRAEKIYEKVVNGRPVTDASGIPVLSPLGQRYAENVALLQQKYAQRGVNVSEWADDIDERAWAAATATAPKQNTPAPGSTKTVQRAGTQKANHRPNSLAYQIVGDKEVGDEDMVSFQIVD